MDFIMMVQKHRKASSNNRNTSVVSNSALGSGRPSPQPSTAMILKEVPRVADSIIGSTASLIPYLREHSKSLTEAALGASISYLKSISLNDVVNRASAAWSVIRGAFSNVTEMVWYLKPFVLPSVQFEEFSLDFIDAEPRHKTSYKSNITASIALPPRITSYSHSIVLKPTPSSQSITDRIYNSVSIFFPKQSPAPAMSKPVNTAATISPVSTTSVRDVMEALEATIQTLTDPIAIDKIHLQKVELVAEEIKEHAARRVDLFFYLFIAVYQKEVKVRKIANAELQHGKGSEKAGTHACHSSLFPNIELIPLDKNAKPVSYEDKHFNNSQNATVELPWVVNLLFDVYLERVRRQSGKKIEKAAFIKYCLKILNAGAKNQIEPPAAMNLFYSGINKYFTYYKKAIQKGLVKYPLTLAKILEYQKEGTFWGADKDLKIKEEYLHMMLRIKPGQLHFFNTLFPYYKTIQDEIYTSEPTKPERRHVP